MILFLIFYAWSIVGYMAYINLADPMLWFHKKFIESKEEGTESRFRFEIIFLLITVLFGIILGPITLVYMIQTIFLYNDEDDEDEEHP